VALPSELSTFGLDRFNVQRCDLAPVGLFQSDGDLPPEFIKDRKEGYLYIDISRNAMEPEFDLNVQRVRAQIGWLKEALGDGRRIGDWTAYFTSQLAEQPWRELLATWWPRLLPGIAAGATHGVIRTGHVVRTLLSAEANAPTLDELAHALAFWAARARSVPPAAAPAGQLDPQAALDAVPRIASQQGNLAARFGQPHRPRRHSIHHLAQVSRHQQRLDQEEPDLLADYLGPDAVAFVEWPPDELWKGAGLPRDLWRISIAHAGGDERLIEIARALSIESHYVDGGVGSLTAEVVAENGLATRLVRAGPLAGRTVPVTTPDHVLMDLEFTSGALGHLFTSFAAPAVSSTTSTPSSFQGSAPGSRSFKILILWPRTMMF